MADHTQQNPAQEAQEPELSEILQIRRDRLAKLKAEGKDPFAVTRFDRTAYAAQVIERFDQLEGQQVSLAGRIMTWRDMGKVSFLDLRDGSGKKAYIEGYRVAGKTGTAQKYEDGHIAQGKYVSSFVGCFPANSPKYLALVIVDEPQGAYYGSAVAAPCAKEIFEGVIEVFGLKPQGE